MKKVLLSSTALVVFAGVASAEVLSGGPGDISLSGNAEMGVFGGQVTIDHSFDDVDDTEVTEELQFWQSIDMDITYSGTTDGGLTFGADFDIDEVTSLGEAEGDGFIFISGTFGTVTLGDTDGALDNILSEADIGNSGSINDAETVHLGFMGSWLDGQGDGQIARYDYSFDAFSFSASLEQHDDCVGGGFIVDASGPGVPEDCDDDELTWGIAGGYSFQFGGGSLDVGIGYQEASELGASVFSLVSNDPDDTGSINDVVGDVFVDPTPDLLDEGEDTVGRAGMVGASAVFASDTGFSAGISYFSTAFENVDEHLTHVGIGGGYTFNEFTVHANWGQYNIEDYTITGYGLAAGYDLGGGAALLAGWGQSMTDDFDFALDPDDDADDFNSSVYSLGLSFSF